VFASCMPRVQLYVNACNGWPQFALQHHWLLPINCHFLLLYSAAGRGIAAVSSAIRIRPLPFYLLVARYCCRWSCSTSGSGESIVSLSKAEDLLMSELQYSKERAQFIAKHFDKNGDGKLSSKELENFKESVKQTSVATWFVHCR